MGTGISCGQAKHLRVLESFVVVGFAGNYIRMSFSGAVCEEEAAAGVE